MTKYDYDLFVIGGGSGGVRAARMAAGLGKRVAIAEKDALGGTCVNVGCIPKKLFSYASHFSDDLKDAAGYGWTIDRTLFNWKTLLSNKNREIKRLNGIYKSLLTTSGADIIKGHARLGGGNSVIVSGKSYSAETILIAVGGKPEIPIFLGSEHVISSDQAFYLDKLPKDVVVVGGGYIAVEFASIFNGLGCETLQLYRGDLFLRGFDTTARKFLASQIRGSGIDLQFNTSVLKIEREKKKYIVTLSSNKKIETDLIMYATGRSPNVDNLGLDEVNILTNKKNAIVVNENYQTSIRSVFAIGDVTDRVNLTPVALAEAMSLISFLYGNDSKKVSYEAIPSAVFSLPNLATVGYTEDEAREKYEHIEVFISEFRALKHTLTDSHERTLMKLIVEKKNNLVVGAHMVGTDAGESIQGIAVAIKAGATKKMFDETIGIHPTSAEEWVTMREPVN